MSFHKPVRSLLTGAMIFFLASLGVLAMRLLPQQTQQPKSGTLTQPPRPAPEPPGAISRAPGYSGPLTVGERLTFNVSWSNFVTAARMELEVANRGAFFGQDGYLLRTRVETIGYARTLLADVDSQYNSYIDAVTLLPYRVENSTRQGRGRVEELITLDQAGKSARYSSDNSEIQLPASTLDLASMLYTLRFRDLKPGTVHKFTVLFGKTLIELEAVARPSERVITQAGPFDAIRVDFSSKGSSFDAAKYRVRAWFSNDVRRIPVLVTMQPPFGEMRAELSSASITSQPRTEIGRTGEKTPPLLVSIAAPPPGAVFEAINIGEVPADNLPFVVGEKLNYDISWGNFVSVGKASFAVRRQGKLNNQRVYEFVSEAASLGAARAVLSINDIFTSYADAEKLFPVRTETRLREGSRNKEITADYDRATNTAKLSSGTVTPIRPGTLDLVSLFYAVRAADLKPGTTFNLETLDSNHNPKALTFKVVREERIGSPLGPQDTIQLDLLRTENQQLLAQAWLTKDARKLPVYLVVRLRIGELRFQLSSFTGTR